MVSVSVVIPTYEDSASVSAAIDSVLDQTFSDLELIVVDDCSTDETPQVVADYADPRVTYVRHGENQGGSAARNTGIRLAEGEYVAFLDADDTWHPRKLERQVSCLQSRSAEWIAVYCDAEYDSAWTVNRLINRFLNVNASKRGTEGDTELIELLLLGEASVAAGSTLLAETEHVEAIGGFDEAFVRHQDWEFLIRLLERGKCAYVDEELVTVRRAGSASPDKEHAAKELFLETFAEQVEAHPLPRRAIENKHRYLAAKLYLENGRFREGYEVLPDVRDLAVPNYVGLSLSLYRYAASRLP